MAFRERVGTESSLEGCPMQGCSLANSGLLHPILITNSQPKLGLGDLARLDRRWGAARMI